MTSGIGAPAAGAADGPAGLLGELAPVEVLLEDAGTLVCGCPERSPTVCEHPATSNDTATSAAIRIPPG
jgi:hypothetical protein